MQAYPVSTRRTEEVEDKNRTQKLLTAQASTSREEIMTPLGNKPRQTVQKQQQQQQQQTNRIPLMDIDEVRSAKIEEIIKQNQRDIDEHQAEIEELEELSNRKEELSHQDRCRLLVQAKQREETTLLFNERNTQLIRLRYGTTEADEQTVGFYRKEQHLERVQVEKREKEREKEREQEHIHNMEQAESAERHRQKQQKELQKKEDRLQKEQQQLQEQ